MTCVFVCAFANQPLLFCHYFTYPSSFLCLRLRVCSFVVILIVSALRRQIKIKCRNIFLVFDRNFIQYLKLSEGLLLLLSVGVLSPCFLSGCWCSVTSPWHIQDWLHLRLLLPIWSSRGSRCGADAFRTEAHFFLLCAFCTSNHH